MQSFKLPEILWKAVTPLQTYSMLKINATILRYEFSIHHFPSSYVSSLNQLGGNTTSYRLRRKQEAPGLAANLQQLRQRAKQHDIFKYRNSK